MGALRFGHLPTIMIPGGPMPSGISNKAKAHTRELYAEGKASREELLDSEIGASHTKGTCTFYGTANTNQDRKRAVSGKSVTVRVVLGSRRIIKRIYD